MFGVTNLITLKNFVNQNKQQYLFLVYVQLSAQRVRPRRSLLVLNRALHVLRVRALQQFHLQ